MSNEKHYSGSLTREQFLFYEIRTISSLLCEGNDRKEIYDKVAQENLFQYPTERMIRSMTNICFKRIDSLDSETLVEFLANASTSVAKQINLYAIMLCDDEDSMLIVGQQVQDVNHKRSDLTAIDTDGNIVLIEIKRDVQDILSRKEPLEFQAIRYAASCATIKTSDELVQNIFAPYVEKHRSEFGEEALTSSELAEQFVLCRFRVFHRIADTILWIQVAVSESVQDFAEALVVRIEFHFEQMPEAVSDKTLLVSPVILVALIFGIHIETERFQVGALKSECSKNIFQAIRILGRVPEGFCVIRIHSFKCNADSCHIGLNLNLPFTGNSYRSHVFTPFARCWNPSQQ